MAIRDGLAKFAVTQRSTPLLRGPQLRDCLLWLAHETSICAHIFFNILCVNITFIRVKRGFQVRESFEERPLMGG